jgi:hypothetical protein
MHGTAPGQVPVPVTSIGGLVTLARPETLPEGASPRNYDWDYLVGSGKTRDGLTSVYDVVNESLGPNIPASAVNDPIATNLWSNPTSIFAVGSSFASVSTQSRLLPGPGGNPVVQPLNFLDVTEFDFNLPGTSSITGILLTLFGYANVPATIEAQILVNGSPVGDFVSVSMPMSGAAITLGSLTNGWNAFVTSSQANATNFGVRISVTSRFIAGTAFVNSCAMTLGLNTGTANFQYVTTFTDQAGNVKNLSIDAQGNFWVENVATDPGTLALVRTGIADNSLITSSQGSGVQFLTFGNGYQGIDMPLQYTPKWIDRITQVGPGQAPTFTPLQASSTQYPIVNITQYPISSTQFIEQLWSTGPGTTTPGNVVTIYYSQTEDTTLTNAFTQGLYPVYVYLTNLLFTDGNGVWQVTSVGQGQPVNESGQNWYYFTYSIGEVGFGFNRQGTPGNYQQTVATVTTSTPVPNALPGNQITITGNSLTPWNAAWRIVQAPNVSQMAITGSQVASGIATLNYSSTNASPPPAVGELVTITNTLNAGGALNVTNAVIQTATGGSTGSFTIFVPVPDFGFEAEDGLATTAGTVFLIDPGPGLVGTVTDPIYGTGTGGDLVYNSSGLFIDPGTYQGTCGFITRNGLWSFPAPPVTFTVPENTTGLQVSGVLLGPEDVVGRYISITEAGQNGVPGGNFFVLPTPVNFYSANQLYTATSTVINDNMTTSVNLFFTGQILDEAEAIDRYGYNLFQNIEIGDPGWTIAYGGRQWFGLCVNKVQNFVNLSFDGGPSSGKPPGWSTPDIYGSVIPSPKFGNSYYIKNTSGSTLTQAGLIQQTAYQDWELEPVIEPNTTYSVRVTVSNPSGIQSGDLAIALVSAGVVLGSYTLPLASMTTNLQIYEGTLLVNQLTTVPSSAVLQVYASNLGVNADILLDRFDVVPTEIPILTTTVFGSYAGLPEQVDAVTGTVGFASENQQPVNGAMVLYDTFYGLKAWAGKTPGSSLYSLQKGSDLEPAQWDEPEVAQRSGGAIGPLAFDLGEQWFLGASRNGLYLFVGGQPGKITQEIYQVWDAVNWKSAQSIWVKVDLDERRIYVGVPMSTPNFWLPNAPVNADPTSPNVILMCDFKGLDSGEELKQYPQMHTTMFGTLNAIDMRRKWSIWQIPSPYANFVQTAEDFEFYICNGRGTSKIYYLDPEATTDDGLAIDSLYTTAGLPELGKRTQMPQLGKNRVRWGYMTASLESAGNIQLNLYANRLPGPGTPPVNSWTLPGGFTPGQPFNDDAETALNFAATRTFLEFRQNDGLGGFSLANLVPFGEKEVWNQFRGRTGA